MTVAQATVATDQHVFLIGRPPVGEFLGFIRALAVDGQSQNQGQLTAEWRLANDHVLQLETQEPGVADNPAIAPLPQELSGMETELRASPYFQRAFQFVPTDIAIVELDRLIVFQKHIDLTHVAQIRASLPQNPNSRDLFEVCLPLNREPAPVRLMQTAQNIYTFISPSTDFRFCEAVLLDPAQISGYPAMGPVTATIALVVGYGSNYLNAVHVDNRLVLSNGSHRAYALREHGVTHVPCAVQRVTRRDELELIGSDELKQNPDRYLKSPRPPLLKDYFDQRLRKLVPVARKLRMVKVSFGVDTGEIPAH